MKSARTLGLLVLGSLFLVFQPAVLSQNGEAPTSPFDKLRFREIGPAAPSGRIDDFAVLENNPVVFYVATATGGLWKTVNSGTTFETVFDNEATSSIGDVAIAPFDANHVWVGSGENNNRQSSSWGDGVYKSTDGGKTWKNSGLRDSKQIARIIVDPIDHDIVYVAALGSLWGPGGERGVYKTNDGGLTWSRVLAGDENTGATELVMDPSNNKVLYAATYQRRRSTWGMNGGGPGSAIYKSTDAGRSWIKLTKGLPDGPLGRIGLDIYRKNPNVLYARIEHARESGVYRSDDAGASWTKISNTNPRPMYFSQIRVDPTNELRVYVLGVQLHVSDDGGKTFRSDGARRIHVDFHAMWINPNNSDHLILGGDGGVGISYDRSKTYVWLRNLNLSQFYHISYDMKSPYTVCGGLQDNNTWCGPSAVRSSEGIANDHWWIIGGGDGFVALIDPGDDRIMYSESQDGRMNRVDRLTNERKPIRPEPPEGERPFRWNWDTPMMISP
ncbi:MAG: glycosyl hydrolase, partial [Acidobacteria bacterium]|nr:glycosyl hydrolase [Acidobacteriota bacterium]